MAENIKFYKDHYDVIIVGCSLAGMSAGMTLAKEGKSVLILERHNLPGGLATSFVRSGHEMEATLHEMMSIGKKEERLPVGKYLDDMKVAIDWLRVPEAFRLYVPTDDIDILIHAGIDSDGVYVAAKEIEEKYPGNLEKVDKLLHLCKEVMESTNYLNDHTASKIELLKNHSGLAKTAGYSAKEVMDAFEIPEKVQAVLSAYWIYVGQPVSSLPFTIFAFLLGDYLTGGSFVAKNFSHGMSVAMAEKCLELGCQIEYRTEVTKILVKDGKAYGVRTAHGEEIHGHYIISGVYPDAVFGHMIEPQSEVPEKAVKLYHGRKIGVTCFSVVLLLDQTPEQLGIKDYSIFSGTSHFDTDAYWAQGSKLGGWDYLTTICLNYANPEQIPEGMTSLSITNLPLPVAFEDVKADDYFAIKRKYGKEMIESISKLLGVNLLDHVVEVEIESPATISHYSGQYLGGIYGYQHSMDDAIAARLETYGKEHYIQNLTWASSATLAGDGMAINIKNGRIAAKVVDTWEKEGK